MINDKMIKTMCMKRRYILIIWSILLTLLPLLNGCIREEEFDNTPQGNFEALWKIINEQYCFLDYKQIDWDAIHDKYQPLITPGMSNDGLFEILGNMLAELKDGHVNLYSSSNMARYWWSQRRLNPDLLCTGRQSDWIGYNVLDSPMRDE